MTYAALGAWAFVCLFPLYWMAVTSLKSEADIFSGPRYLPFADFTPSLEAWMFILTDANDNLLMRYWNSAVVGLASTLLTLLLGGSAAYGLRRFPSASPRADHSASDRNIFAAILATRLLPPVAIVLPFYLMAQTAGMLDTRASLVLVYTAVNLPVAMWLLRPVFGATASEQEEAAWLDGASRPRIFFEIAAPMAAAGIAATGALIFILCWNEYLFAAYLAGDRSMTLPPWLVGQMSIKEAQTGSEAEEWANFSAATVLMAAPVLAFAALAQRALGRFAARRP